MDYENSPFQQASNSFHPNPSFTPQPYAPQPQTKKKGVGWKIFWGIVLFLSVLTNLFLLISIAVMATFFSHTSGKPSMPKFDENVLIDGSRNRKRATRLAALQNAEPADGESDDADEQAQPLDAADDEAQPPDQETEP